MGQFVAALLHGKTVELEESPNFADGEAVTLYIRPSRSLSELAPGDGIRRSAGGWSDDVPGLDDFLDWNRQRRKVSRAENQG
jgi:hypothetical protein